FWMPLESHDPALIAMFYSFDAIVMRICSDHQPVAGSIDCLVMGATNIHCVPFQERSDLCGAHQLDFFINKVHITVVNIFELTFDLLHQRTDLGYINSPTAAADPQYRTVLIHGAPY